MAILALGGLRGRAAAASSGRGKRLAGSGPTFAGRWPRLGRAIDGGRCRERLVRPRAFSRTPACAAGKVRQHDLELVLHVADEDAAQPGAVARLQRLDHRVVVAYGGVPLLGIEVRAEAQRLQPRIEPVVNLAE